VVEIFGEFSTLKEMRNALKILVGKSKGWRPLRIPRNIWDNNSKTDVKYYIRIWLDIRGLKQ
jgi:hypothetical protein